VDLQHVNVKIFVDGEMSTPAEDIIKVFHRWVSEQLMDELLIDVADYDHVPKGPGIVLVGHQADYAMDETDGRPGLRYNCKVARQGSNEDRCLHALRSAAKACLRLESELDGLKFSRNEFQVTINDRAQAPNSDETRVACEGVFKAFLGSVLGQGALGQGGLGQSDFKIDYESDPRRLTGVVVSLANPLDFDGLGTG